MNQGGSIYTCASWDRGRIAVNLPVIAERRFGWHPKHGSVLPWLSCSNSHLLKLFTQMKLLHLFRWQAVCNAICCAVNHATIAAKPHCVLSAIENNDTWNCVFAIVVRFERPAIGDWLITGDSFLASSPMWVNKSIQEDWVSSFLFVFSFFFSIGWPGSVVANLCATWGLKFGPWCHIYLICLRGLSATDKGNEGQRVWTGYFYGWGYAREDNRNWEHVTWGK